MEWMWKDWEKCTGFLDAAQGRLWDSKRFPFAVRQRKGNMPPFCWVGDDDRGVCFSCASDQGMHNDDALPAATLDREGRAVVFRAWFVNKPLKLDKPRSFEFALQASPFKPLDPSHRLWRCGVSRNDCCYGTHGRYFHTGWGIGYYWPTYGRFLDLAKNAAAIRRVRQSGFDYHRRLGLVLLGMRRHARVPAVLARVGQRAGLGQDAAGPLAGVDGQAHAGLRRTLRSVRVAGKRLQ